MENNWPDFPDLFAAAWRLTRFNWKYLFGLNIATSILSTSASMVAAYLIVMSIRVPVLASYVGVALLCGLAIVAVLLYLILTLASMLILSQSEKIELVPTFRLTLKLLPSFLLVSFLTFLLATGGLGLLVIPGIAISFLLSFSIYEYVFFDVKRLDAIVNSMQIVSQNWRQLLVFGLPVFILLLGYGLVMLLIQKVLSMLGAPMVVLSVLKVCGSALFTVLTYNLSFVMYLTARERTDGSRTVPLIPMVSIAVLGWVVILFVLLPNFLQEKFTAQINPRSKFPIETIAPYRPVATMIPLRSKF